MVYKPTINTPWKRIVLALWLVLFKASLGFTLLPPEDGMVGRLINVGCLPHIYTVLPSKNYDPKTKLYVRQWVHEHTLDKFIVLANKDETKRFFKDNIVFKCQDVQDTYANYTDFGV